MEHTETAASPPASIDPFEGVVGTFNEADIRATRRFLAHEGHGITEVRVISPGRGVTGIGYFDNDDAFVAACAEASGTGNVYVGIQPRPARFLAQAPNRLARLRAGAHDQDIEQVTAVVMDLDPVRRKDAASTEEELAQAIAEATRLADWLASRGMVRPVRVMSGNGCHLWLAVPPISVEQAGRDELTERLKAFEAKVRGQVTGAAVKLDSIYNLSRIIKVSGTLSVKGEPTTARPVRGSGQDRRGRRRRAARHDVLGLRLLAGSRLWCQDREDEQTVLRRLRSIREGFARQHGFPRLQPTATQHSPQEQ